MTANGIVAVEFQQALALHRVGHIDAAASAYEQILEADPDHVDALVHLGALRLRQDQAAAAEVLLRRALRVSPGLPAAQANLAAALQGLGRVEEATAAYEAALALDANMADAWFGLAMCRQASGRPEAAVTCYEAVLQANPAQAEANYALAVLLLQLDRAGEAVGRLRAAVAADPDFAEANYELGKLLSQGAAAGEAVACFNRALDVDPDYLAARLELAATLSRLDRDDDAIAAFHAVLAAEPDHPDALTGIGGLLDRKRLHAEAMAYFRAVLARDPEHQDALAGMANSLRQIGQHAEALAIAHRVVALRPDLASAASLLGRILAEMGSLDEAEAQYRRAVALAPDRPEFHYYLGQVVKARPEDDTIPRLEAALARIASLPAQEQCLLHFALAKACQDTGAADRAFSHIMQGNAVRRRQMPYDEAARLDFMRRIAGVFDADLIARHDSLGDPSDVPVFIVGMPRSGTTLVEQVLASHPSVFGAGERSDLSQAMLRLSAARLGATPFPEAVWTMPAGQLRELGAEYAATLRVLAPAARRITDKMPNNFHFLGMIRMILPHARIIHVMRDPVDTCLSCFSTLFADGQPFSCDLAELGRYYRAYQGLMTHWRSVLPAGAMLEVDYRAVVEDFATQARRIVAYCGLEWDPACLDFHKTARPVRTASMAQVRQPIYRSSVGRWRPAPAVLRPLLEALGSPEVPAVADGGEETSGPQ